MESTNGCAHCGEPFVYTNQRYNRTKIHSNLLNSETTYFSLLSTTFGSVSGDFICNSCKSLLLKLYHGETAADTLVQKRKSSPGNSPLQTKHVKLTTYTRKNDRLKNAAVYLRQSKFPKLYAALQKSKAARRAFYAFAETVIRKEVRKMSGGPLSKELTMRAIQEWSWEEVVGNMSEQCPLLSHAIAGAISKPKQRNSKKTQLHMGFSLAHIAHLRKPREYKLLQGINSILMWKCHASQGLMKSFNHLGITTSSTTARSNVDRILEDFDHKIKTWKREMEDQVYKAMHRPACRSLFPSGNNQGIGFTICWDNVQLETEVRHQGPDKNNKLWMWAMCYAAKNRVPFPGATYPVAQTKRCQEIPVECILPTKEDFDFLKERMVQEVMVILVGAMGHFQQYYRDCCEVATHPYHKSSGGKSELVNLGVIEENPSSTNGVIQILQHLQQYTPLANGAFIPIVVHGDGLSVERHIDAQRARSASHSDEGRLKGLVPTPQEFHKRSIILQDTMNTLMEASGTSRGSALNVKALFNHRNVSRDVGKCFNHAVDFLELMTHGYVTLMAMEMAGIQDIDQVPEDSPYEESTSARQSYLFSLARSIVDITFPVRETAEELEEQEDFDGDYPFCTCKTKKHEQMVRCSNLYCQNGKWFHLPCCELNEEPDGDWYCCIDCQTTGSSVYCTCKEVVPGSTMVECSNAACTIGWYHVHCQNKEVAENGDWYCSHSCENKTPERPEHQDHTDHKLEYTKTVIDRGLYDLVHRGAIRANDGEALMKLWKVDMLQFHQKNHTKYIILGHTLLTDISGFQTKRLAHDMKWNRTVNLDGGNNSNIAMDLANEFLNREFKEKLKHARGRYTDKDIHRKSVIIGPIEKEITKQFDADTSSKNKTTGSTSQNVKKFVSEYREDNLCKYVANRPGHKKMENHVNQEEIRDPIKLLIKLRNHSKKRDLRRQIMNR